MLLLGSSVKGVRLQLSTELRSHSSMVTACTMAAGADSRLRLSSPACAYSALESLITARMRGLVCVVLEVWWCGCEASFNNSNHSVPFHAPDLTYFCYVLKKLIRLVLCLRKLPTLSYSIRDSVDLVSIHTFCIVLVVSSRL